MVDVGLEVALVTARSAAKAGAPPRTRKVHYGHAGRSGGGSMPYQGEASARGQARFYGSVEQAVAAARVLPPMQPRMVVQDQIRGAYVANPATAMALERRGHKIVGSGRRPIPLKLTKGERLVHEAAFKAFDEEKQVGFAEVYVPNEVDSHGEYMTAPQIEAMAWKFLPRLIETGSPGIDVMHDNKVGRLNVVESFIARNGDPDFAPGAWVLGTKFLDRDLWLAAKRGELSGFSFEAMVVKRPRIVEVSDDHRVLREVA